MTKGFLSFAPYSRNDLNNIFGLTRSMKGENPKHFKPLRDKTAALVFEKPSLRTHDCFEVGILQLGGQSVYLSGSDLLPQAQNRLHVRKGIVAYLFGAKKPVSAGQDELLESIFA